MSLTEALLEQFGMDLKEIVLIPSMGGIFEVTVDGELVHSKRKTGRLPLIADIKKIVRQRILT